MKRFISLAVTVSIILLCLYSCNTRYIPVYGENIIGPYFHIIELPKKEAGGETTLEFWIGDKIVESDYQNHTNVFNGFLGEGYELDPDNQNGFPKFYVRYIVENYPSIDSKTKGVTEIVITDPYVKVYGLTTMSSIYEFADAFEKLGATVSISDNLVRARLNDACFTLRGSTKNSHPVITISTDQVGIVNID